MARLTKQNIDGKAIYATYTARATAGGAIFDLRPVTIADVTLSGDKARIYYGSSKLDTLEVLTDSDHSTVFIYFDQFWDWISNIVFRRAGGSTVYARFKDDGYRKLLITDVAPTPDPYGHLHMLDTIIKYGEKIPNDYYLINVREEVKRWFTDHCGPGYAEDKTTKWYQCINCGSDDLYFEYENTDNATEGGTYEDVWKCEKCGAKTRRVYELKILDRELERD